MTGQEARDKGRGGKSRLHTLSDSESDPMAVTNVGVRVRQVVVVVMGVWWSPD